MTCSNRSEPATHQLEDGSKKGQTHSSVAISYITVSTLLTHSKFSVKAKQDRVATLFSLVSLGVRVPFLTILLK